MAPFDGLVGQIQDIERQHRYFTAELLASKCEKRLVISFFFGNVRKDKHFPKSSVMQLRRGVAGGNLFPFLLLVREDVEDSSAASHGRCSLILFHHMERACRGKSGQEYLLGHGWEFKILFPHIGCWHGPACAQQVTM